MRQNNNKQRDTAAEWDSKPSYIKVAVYAGDKKHLPVFGGSVQVGDKEYHVSFNLPDGSVVTATIIKSRDASYEDSIYITDILRFGKSDLSAVLYKSRYEVLELLCPPISEDYGFATFGAKCIAPYVFLAVGMGAKACLRCNDPRVIGYEVISLTEHVDSVEVIKGASEEDETVDSVENHPPVENEANRVKEYKALVKSMINKITGKWRDANKSHHQPSLLPYDRDDLMQFGMMQAMIAIRKYNADNKQKASEFTFVFQHLYNRFGQLAHKYSKDSKGYGVSHSRDYVNDEGVLVCAYDAAATKEVDSDG